MFVHLPPVLRALLYPRVVRAIVPGLEFVLGRELDRDVQEGARHSRISAVVQLIAVKPWDWDCRDAPAPAASFASAPVDRLFSSAILV